MTDMNGNQPSPSNRDADWGRLYDFYEVQMREVYQTVSRPQNESHFELLKWFVERNMPADPVFCEIGFSAGLTLRFASTLFSRVCGLDISSKNVDYTRKELEKEGYKNIELYHSDLMKKEDRFENTFDVISFIHGLEHFSGTDYPVIFNNIRHYLRKDGVFTGALPYKGRLNYRMCPSCHHVFEIDGHISSHDKGSLASLFREHHFEIIYLENFNPWFNRKQKNFLKKTYRHLSYEMLKRESNNQLEFIVRPGAASD